MSYIFNFGTVILSSCTLHHILQFTTNTPLFILLDQWIIKLFTKNILHKNVRILWVLDSLQQKKSKINNKKIKTGKHLTFLQYQS